MRASSPRMRLVGRQGWLQKLPLRPSLSLVRFSSLRVVSLLSCFLIPPRLGSDLATPVVHSSFFFFFRRPSLRLHHHDSAKQAADPTNSEPGQPHRVRRCNVHPSPNNCCSAPASSHAKNARWLGNRSGRRPGSPICPSRAFSTLPSHVALPSRIRSSARPCVRPPAFWPPSRFHR
ncbi:hypothetical protein IWZ00DRAFT_187327 [Phyllosticta capitalensis]